MKKFLFVFVAAMLINVTNAFAQWGGTIGQLTWSLSPNTQVLTISGVGDMPDFEPGEVPWYTPFHQTIGVIQIESGVKSIGNYAFYNHQILQTVTFNSSTLTSIGESAFERCLSLFSITIPTTIKSIEKYAFGDCLILKTVNYNAIDCTTVGYSAFYFGSTEFTTLNIGSAVVNIPNGAFSYCTGLTSVTIPSNVKTIGELAFEGCSGLGSVIINGNSSGTTIKNQAFSYCDNLTSITFSGNVIIGAWGLSYCTGLTSITLPNNVKAIGEWGFSSCTNLTSVVIPNSITSIENNTFSQCTNLKSVTLPNSLKTIGEHAFSQCTSLPSITISGSVTNIGEYAFGNCTNLTSVTIPNSVTTIGNGAFSYCTSLPSITIPSSVTTIGNYAFLNCESLTSISNLRLTPITISATVFTYVNQSACTLDVPTSSASLYANKDVWKKFNIANGGVLVDPVSSNSDYGYTTGNELYPEGKTDVMATVTAVPFSGGKFVKWEKEGVEVSKNNPYTFLVTEDVQLVAVFEAVIAPVITTTTLQGGLVGTAYNQQIIAAGTAPITWSLESGNLPTGLTLSSSGVITGTPTVVGTSTFTVKAENSAGSDTKSFSIEVTTTAIAPVITTNTLLAGTVGVAYSAQLTATGSAPITWTKESGNLPAGLTLSSSGLISGTPTTAGTFPFTVKATNSAGSDTKALSITINPATGISISGKIIGNSGEEIGEIVYLYKYTENGIPEWGMCTYADNAGNYSFTDLPAGEYLIVSQQSVTSHYLTTYYGDVTTWEKAKKAVVSNASLTNININLQWVPAMNGVGAIPGYIYLNSGGKKGITGGRGEIPIFDVNVILQQHQSDWTTVAQAITDGNGHYKFEKLPAGKFRVLVDYPCIPMNDIISLTLAEGETSADVNYIITNNGINPITGIGEITNDELRIFPNPTDGVLHVETQCIASLQDVEIFDMMGRMVYTVKTRFIASPQDGTTTIDLSNLPTGMYFIRIQTETGVVVRKVVKQ